MRKFPSHMKRQRHPADWTPPPFDQAINQNSYPFYTFDFFSGQQTIMRLYIGQQVIADNRQDFNDVLEDLRNYGIRHEPSLEGKPKFVLDSIEAVRRKSRTIKSTFDALKKTWQE